MNNIIRDIIKFHVYRHNNLSIVVMKQRIKYQFTKTSKNRVEVYVKRIIKTILVKNVPGYTTQTFISYQRLTQPSRWYKRIWRLSAMTVHVIIH